jgi:hypothetical protein
MHLPLRRFLNAVLVWCYRRVEDRDKFVFELERPVRGKATRSDPVREMDEFAAFASSVGGLR